MLYVYALTGSAPRRPGRGLAREPLRALDWRGAWVVTGEMDDAPSPTPASLQRHDAVVRRLARRCRALLPARFGWTAARENELRSALAPHRRAVAQALRDVEGCVQMTVRVFGETAAARRGVAAGRRTPARASGAGRGTSYLRARAQAWRDAESLPELAPVQAHLAGLLRGERHERHDSGGLVGTAYHLVERDRVRAYRARLRRAAAEMGPWRLHVSGPWAPYAFGPRAMDR